MTPCISPFLKLLGIGSYLAGFIRSTEAFYPEHYTLDARARWVREDALPSSRVVRRTYAWQSGGFIETGASEAGPYVLTVSQTTRELELARRDADGVPRSVQRWPLPHDATLKDEFELCVLTGPGDGRITELTLLRNGDWFGFAVEVAAPEPLARPAQSPASD